MRDPLHQALRAALGVGSRTEVWPPALDVALDTIERTMPALPAPGPEFMAELVDRLDPGSSPREAIASLEIADLYLASCCVRGIPEALHEFERRFGPDLARALRRSSNTGADPDDLRQLLYERLFVAGPDRPAKLSSYSGRGGLRAWLRITTTRLLLNTARDHGRRPASAVTDDEVLERIIIEQTTSDPELGYIEAGQRKALTDALAVAFRSLSARERNVLRHSVLRGVSSQGLAELYGVHRATVFRWRQGAVATLMDAVRTTLRTMLALAPAELDSLLCHVDSRLDLSVQRLLGPLSEPERDG